ncbi:hypothetical protein FOMPIDRAFT_1016641 [Fomitopsis schrenkii]|uniref:Uncharacterized protein n=1 Tax=Fomitopsis schrenkii TaxID=2126942 RepID=S8E603_FOMSC|nr:hypothetical protein FOMPIDRAFT_1016641 [Fomitopsis schrenkii]
MKGPSFLIILIVLFSALLVAIAQPLPVDTVRARRSLAKRPLKQYQMKRGQPGSATNRLRARASPSPSPRPSPSPSKRYVAPAIRTEYPQPTHTDRLGAWY